MALDRWIALFFLIVSLIYGYAAFNYPLLPFERGMAFLPNTQPMALSLLGVVIALVILLSPKAKDDDTARDGIDLAQLRQFRIGQALGLVAAMVLYALLLRPVGFLAATTLFLIGSAAMLGARDEVWIDYTRQIGINGGTSHTRDAWSVMLHKPDIDKESENRCHREWVAAKGNPS